MKKPTIVVLMGTMSVGKTFFGQQLAAKLGWPFFEADRFHSPENKKKMGSGIPLTDEDRWPWLQAIATEMQKQFAAGQSSIFTCSALKRKYRDLLRVVPVKFIHLYAPQATLEERSQARAHEFMPASLLQSALRTLEVPEGEDDVISINTDGPADKILEEIIRAASE